MRGGTWAGLGLEAGPGGMGVAVGTKMNCAWGEGWGQGDTGKGSAWSTGQAWGQEGPRGQGGLRHGA